MSNNIIVYGHAICPGVGPVKGLLTQVKAPFQYIDIHHDLAAAAQVRGINGGNESVPTLVFPDGSTLTEPTVAQISQKLSALGYKVGPMAWLIGNSWRIFIALLVLIALLRLFGFF